LSGNNVASDPVVIAVDPHKASWTAAAVDSALRPLATIRVPVSHAGYQQLRRFAARWPTAVWAIEGAGGAGARSPHASPMPGSRRWTCLPSSPPGSGCCPPDTAARTMTPMPSRSGSPPTAPRGCGSAKVEDAITALRALVEHRDDVVHTRTQTVNRLHVLLTQLLPGGAP
jgi:hypothetical protein